ncbi:sigma-E factor negative regulatory protein [Vibrio sp. Y2-5]|uniref:sigma-E factor negative regulatory protein n=1 Tax=Vibrio sp. Y2-5 TaxID=2743977 RepID=UPI001660A5EA|nr:sigma-E factor negative regulatory protein [Vibrio sp. Y2-5]MBD0787403.1 sigma-E factor negative regulatory protein [Vibrio sp. Y2-5]
MADKQQLSALMDGEMVDKLLIQELATDRESIETWKNYHLIGDVMRGDAPERPEWNIAESVALALENEPAHTPYTANVTDLDSMRVVEEQPAPHKARLQLPKWLSPFGQVAVAACVSLIAIIGVQQYGASGSSAADQPFPVLQTVPLSGSVEPVSLTRESVRPSIESNAQEQRRRVNAMLQDYELQLRLNSEGLGQHQDSIEPVTE